MNASRKKFALMAVLAVVLMAGMAMAQEPEIQKKSLLQLFEATGAVGYLMVLCSMIGTALVIEHIVNLRREKLAPAPLIQDLQALIDEEQYDEAIELCDQEGGYISNLVSSALRMRHAGYEEMIQGLEAAANEETFKLQAKISYLSLIGNVGPLLGLLGTVTGMISSFQVIEHLKAPTPGDLARGVYESLVNTTMGLFIGIVFLTAFFVFKNKVTKMTLSMNLQAVDLLKHLAAVEKGP
ncbi:MAG TPA: MotA/TolQ/ExbB proton channel family protein [Planctomycetota bacterium]|jgi:biopolymer transport protein ExbB|nr:MotA/TolQ/ExbB proton channel family protein [Planctomycetota bacterium]